MNTKTKWTGVALLIVSMGFAVNWIEDKKMKETNAASESTFVMVGDAMLSTNTQVLEKLNLRRGQQASNDQVLAIMIANYEGIVTDIEKMEAEQ